MHTHSIDLSFLDDAPPPRSQIPRVVELRPGPAPPCEWDAAEAIWHGDVTDGLLERLGVSGLDPTIAAAAAYCVEAHGHQDLTGVRAACESIRRRARELFGRE